MRQLLYIYLIEGSPDLGCGIIKVWNRFVGFLVFNVFVFKIAQFFKKHVVLYISSILKSFPEKILQHDISPFFFTRGVGETHIMIPLKTFLYT